MTAYKFGTITSTLATDLTMGRMNHRPINQPTCPLS